MNRRDTTWMSRRPSLKQVVGLRTAALANDDEGWIEAHPLKHERPKRGRGDHATGAREREAGANFARVFEQKKMSFGKALTENVDQDFQR